MAWPVDGFGLGLVAEEFGHRFGRDEAEPNDDLCRRPPILGVSLTSPLRNL